MWSSLVALFDPVHHSHGEGVRKDFECTVDLIQVGRCGTLQRLWRLVGVDHVDLTNGVSVQVLLVVKTECLAQSEFSLPLFGP